MEIRSRSTPLLEGGLPRVSGNLGCIGQSLPKVSWQGNPPIFCTFILKFFCPVTTIKDPRGNLLAHLLLINGMMSWAIRVAWLLEVEHHAFSKGRSKRDAPVVNRTL